MLSLCRFARCELFYLELRNESRGPRVSLACKLRPFEELAKKLAGNLGLRSQIKQNE